MPGNKIAEKRADKTGKIVTRHVNAAPPQKPVKAMPAPTLALSLSTAQTTIPHDVGGLQDLWDSNAIRKSTYVQDDFAPDAVAEVDRLLQTSSRKFALSESVQSALNHMVETGSKTDFHNIAIFGKHIVPHAHGDVQSYVAGLYEMGMPDHDYLMLSDHQERAVATTLVEFVARAEALPFSDQIIKYGQSHDATYLADSELAGLIMDHPESADEVFDIISRSKQAMAVDLIKECLEHEQKAFRDGVL